MSRINIKRVVDNIRTGSVYSPLIELIVNGIQAINEKGEKNGKVTIVVQRDTQTEMDNIPAVKGFEIIDNGIGFTDEHRNAFDELYTDQKIEEGGKGFGRFVCLKYFQDLRVESHFKDRGAITKVTFSMGKQNDIIEDIKFDSSHLPDTSTRVTLFPAKVTFQDKSLYVIARTIVEKILPYFIIKDYDCPLITITEQDNSDAYTLNDYANTELGDYIKELPIPDKTFSLATQKGFETFDVRLFKFYSPGTQNSKISLVAHKREVTTTPIHTYVPEFIDEFYDKSQDGENVRQKNYIVKAYVFGAYLDINVSHERGGFRFPKDDPDLFYGISQKQIERKASAIAKDAIGSEIIARQEKKRERVQSYVDYDAPWHHETAQKIDLADMPYHATDAEIESILQTEKFKQEIAVKQEVKKLLTENSPEEYEANAGKILTELTGTSKNDLVHYVCLRRSVLDIFQKSLEIGVDGKYPPEGVVHDIVFPRKGDTDKIPFNNHNLWILDERLNFTTFTTSDKPLNEGSLDHRPDLIVYDKRVVFRGDNELSTPVHVFEFKKPMRSDFANPSSDEDPVEQIVRYVRRIRKGDFTTPVGRKILVNENTPFYGYIVCDATEKVKDWIEEVRNFKPMPDRLGWFHWHDSLNLYIEVLSWEKLLRDATMRNKIFFHKLGIN